MRVDPVIVLSGYYVVDSVPFRHAFLMDATPDSVQLNQMGLKPGINSIQFDVYTGRSQVRASDSPLPNAFGVIIHGFSSFLTIVGTFPDSVILYQCPLLCIV